MAGLLAVGRILLGLSFALDGGWWLCTWDVRAAYLDGIGFPALVIVPVAVTYIVCGLIVATGRAVRPATLPLMAVAGLIATLLHTDLGPGGIGEYPLDQHGPLNASALLGQLALVGALMITFAAPDLRGLVDVRALGLGRVLLGGYFVTDALWQAHFYEDQVARVTGAGWSETLLAGLLALQILFGMLTVMSRAVRLSAAALGALVVLGAILLHTDFVGVAPNAQIHGWFVRGSLLGGLAQLYAVAVFTLPWPEEESLPSTTD